MLKRVCGPEQERERLRAYPEKPLFTFRCFAWQGDNEMRTESPVLRISLAYRLVPLVHWCRVLKRGPGDLEAVSQRRAYSSPRWCRSDHETHSQRCDKPETLLSMWRSLYGQAVPKSDTQENVQHKGAHKTYSLQRRDNQIRQTGDKNLKMVHK